MDWSELPAHLQISTEPLSQKEIETAYRWWLRNYHRYPANETSAKSLKVARRALLHSASSAAEKFKMTKSAWLYLEKAEAKGSISLNSLRKAAEAIECEVVYFIRPKRNIPFSRVVFDDLLKQMTDHSFLSRCVAQMRGNALASRMNRKLTETKVRKAMGRTQKLETWGIY